jgi:peroxiredoxin
MKSRLLILCCLLVLGSTSAGGKLIAPEGVKKVGGRAPIFTLVDQEGKRVNYDRDFYGRHHLILTFFPAAFTPV